MSETGTETKETKPKAKKVKLPVGESRVARKASRATARKARNEKIQKDPEFAKTYFGAKRTRAAARVTVFKKAKSGKK